MRQKITQFTQFPYFHCYLLNSQLPADNPSQIYLKSEKGEIEVLICPEQRTPSPTTLMVPPSPKVTNQLVDNKTKTFGSAQRNLIKSFDDTVAISPTEMALLNDEDSSFVNYLQRDNYFTSVKVEKSADTTCNNLKINNSNKYSPSQIMARNAVQPHSYQEQKTGVRNSLMGGEINTLSPLYLTQCEYADGNDALLF